jgi:hypoxanthine phosphoribosyltransferase
VDYFELSKKGVERNSLLLAKQVVDSWKKLDIVVFIAKGAYPIGRVISAQLNKPLLEIHASRKTSKIKKLVSPFLAIIPYGIKRRLREMEVRSGYHSHHSEREVWFNEKSWELHSGANRILVVDDSVDTGSTIVAVKAAIKSFFPHAEIKVAALNCFSFCSSDAQPDFVLWNDTMLNGPWSNDSKENKEFVLEYEMAKKKKVFM